MIKCEVFKNMSQVCLLLSLLDCIWYSICMAEVGFSRFALRINQEHISYFIPISTLQPSSQALKLSGFLVNIVSYWKPSH